MMMGSMKSLRRRFQLQRSAAGGLALLVAAVFFVGATAVAVNNDEFDGSSYARNVSLDENVNIFWTIIDTTTAATTTNDADAGVGATIRLALHAKVPSAGWAGVGVSEMGGMEGADIVLYETATGEVTDAHAITAGPPVADECSQDWTLLSAEVRADGLVFEVERRLDTDDAQDRVFVDDTVDGVRPTRLIAAWGNSSTVSYHGANFAQGEVVMFGGVENSESDPILEVASVPDVSSFDVRPDDFIIPPIRTWYETTCVSSSDFPAFDAFHAVGFEGVVQGDTADYVHHLLLRAYYGTDDCGQACDAWITAAFPDDAFDPFEGTVELSEFPTSSSSSSSSSSRSSPRSSSSSRSSSLSNRFSSSNFSLPAFCNFNYADIFTWTPGAPDYELPEDVGFRFGAATGGFSSVSVQTHYNNPEENVGVKDSSGVRVYYTEELRPMDMGTMELGDPLVSLAGAPMFDGKSAISFGCPGSCTDELFELDSVKVFGHFLHMHENGRRLVTKQYRDDGFGKEVVVFTAEVEYYSFEQAGAFWAMANDSVTIQKGDRFETTCYYDTSQSSVGSANASFGFGSENEMCVDFVFYYPSQYLPASGACGYAACDGSILDYSALPADSDFNRTFGIVDDCKEEEESTSSASSTLPQAWYLAVSAAAAVFFAGATLLGTPLAT